MATNRNRLVPQLQKCEHLLLPSAVISHAALDHSLHAEVQVRTLPHDVVGFRAADHGGASARNGAHVEGTIKNGLLTQTGSTTGGGSTHVGPNMRVKSCANQAVPTNIVHPTTLAVAGLTKSWSILTAPTTTALRSPLG